jgi:uncharacterized protein YndB with AHSA1/START domain
MTGALSKGEVVSERAVRFVRTLPAAPGKVWTFLTEASRLPEWYRGGLIEPREGGAIHLAGYISGVVTGWRPEKFLAYSWNVLAPGETESKWPMSYVEFALQAEGDQTRLTLTHRPIPEAMQSQTAMGWHTMLDLVAAGLDGEFPKRSDLFPKNAALYGVDLNNLKR